MVPAEDADPEETEIEIDPSKLEREKTIISTILNAWGEYRVIELNERIAQFKWKVLRTNLKGLKRLIQREGLNEWLVQLINVVEDNLWENTEENTVLRALFELWFQLKWLTFDLEEKLVLLDGLETLIPKTKGGVWLSVIVEELREFAKDSIATDLRLQSTLDDRKRP